MQANLVGDRGGNITLSKAAINGSIVGTGALNVANNVTFAIDGTFNTVAANNNVQFSSGHTALAAGCICVFGLWVSSTGVFSTTQGKIVDVASLSAGTGQKVVPLPDMIADNALVGLIKVKTAGAATFTPGTTNCNATNVTMTFYDTMVMPTEPFTS